MTRFLLYCVSMAALIGCGGPDATVQGTVTIDGQLARRGTVLFHPVDGGPMPYGTIADNGSYALRVGQGDLKDAGAEIKSGDYIVTVVVNMPSKKDEMVGETGPPRPGARLTAKKYATKESSDLRATVKAGPNVVPLELEGAAPDEEELEADSTVVETERVPTDETDSEDATASAAESGSGTTPQDRVESESAEPEAVPQEQVQ